jgi:hypothetical protein
LQDELFNILADVLSNQKTVKTFTYVGNINSSNTVDVFNFKGNKIDHAGFEFILKGLKENKSLKELDLGSKN